MSVQVMHNECLNYIHSGLMLAAFRSTCDLYHAGNIYTHFKNIDVETEAERLIESWSTLNNLSFSVGYNESLQASTWVEYFHHYGKHYEVNIYQLLKYVTCLQYNIELETIASKESYSNGSVADVPDLTSRQNEDYELLVKWRDNITGAIIDNIMDYELANWSNIPGTKPDIRGYVQQIIAENKTIQVKQLTAPL